MNNIEKEINKIRLSLYEETKNLTPKQKKEREKKLLNKLYKEFNFEFPTEYPTSQNDFSSGMIAEETSKYSGKKKID